MERKSRRLRDSILSGKDKKGFSLNGALRNQGWVGQGVRGRTLINTPFRGATARGAGGSNGKYKKSIINNSNPPNSGASAYIKRSNMNTPGLINAKVKYPTPVLNTNCDENNCRTEWTQVLDTYTLSQGHYIENKGATSVCTNVVSDAGMKNCNNNDTSDCKARSYFIGGKKFYATLYFKNSGNNSGTISSGEYTQWRLKANNCLPTPECKQHFPMNLNHTGTCDVNYLTPEAAIKAGALPATWPKCPAGTTVGSY